MLNEKDLEKYATTYSIERLKSFVLSNEDTIDDVISRYKRNLRISLALYPELSTLEIILRNAIDVALRMHYSETWIEDELQNNTLLDVQDFSILQNAYQTTMKECKSSSKTLTTGKIIANLNFGFWTNLCTKKYNSKIWNKKGIFKSVFTNYPSKKPDVWLISKKLNAIRKLRNRIFHYEQIFKYPEKTLNLYNELLEVMSYLPKDELKILADISLFKDTYNSLIQETTLKSH